LLGNTVCQVLLLGNTMCVMSCCLAIQSVSCHLLGNTKCVIFCFLSIHVSVSCLVSWQYKVDPDYKMPLKIKLWCLIQAVNWFLYSYITPIFWVRILYSQKPPIFPIFSYILNIIPIFFSELVAAIPKTLFLLASLAL